MRWGPVGWGTGRQRVPANSPKHKQLIALTLDIIALRKAEAKD
ncbi:hypothetical protein Mal33_17320 [Rosistilla oblonga]|uniref:Uncharacterized protein n=1 Tax=Rosistilla oblonga TaxID=2527990 RepID=A0A518IRS8_9BACT|nr:hypothetical protein Mal33_17320 [Rosistilla oblonga]